LRLEYTENPILALSSHKLSLHQLVIVPIQFQLSPQSKMSDPNRRSSGSENYNNPTSYHDQFIKASPPDSKRSSGSTSFLPADEPPPIPPPDYTTVSKEEWAKQRKPPLRGIIAEPEKRPSKAEAQKVLGYDGTPTATGKTGGSTQNKDTSSSLYRSSGTSDILGRAAEAPDQQSHNMMPGGTRHSAGGERFDVEPTVKEAFTNTISHPVLAAQSLFLMPCFKTAMLTGMTAGFVVAGVLWSVGKRIPRAANGAVVTWFVVNPVTFLWCERRREEERKGFRMIREAWEEKREAQIEEWQRVKAERERQGKPVVPSTTEASGSWFWQSGRKTRPGREG
jgi:hypothetical protein